MSPAEREALEALARKWSWAAKTEEAAVRLALTACTHDLRALLSTLTPDKPGTRCDWSQLPPWASWIATDEDGSRWAFGVKPVPETDDDGGFWKNDNEFARTMKLLKGSPCPDWRNSLEQRPKGES